MSTPHPFSSGPAFPVADASACQFIGITVRDYFAAQALQGLLSHPDTDLKKISLDPTGGHVCTAYSLSDAMLAERQKMPSGGGEA